MRSRMWLSTAAAFLLLALPAQAQLTAALDAVPDDAMGIVVVKNIGEGSAKLSALTKRANFPAFDGLAAAKKELGVDKGLDEKGTLVVALLAGDPEPIPLIFAPVTDYADFVKQLGAKDPTAEISEVRGRSVVGKKANFAVFAEAKHRDALKKALAAKKGITSTVQPLMAWLDKTDAAFALNTKGVKEMTKHMEGGLQQGKAALANAPEEAQILVTWIEGIEELLKSTGKDVTHLAVGVQYQQKSGDLTVAKRALFAKGSGFAKAAANMKTPEGGVLGGLPGGEFMMAGGGVISAEVMNSLMALSFQAMKSQLPADKVKKLEGAFKDSFKGIQSMSMVMGLSKPNEPLFSGTVGVLKSADSKKYLEDYTKTMGVMAEVFKGLDNPALPKYNVKKVKVGDLEAIEVITDMSALANADPNAQNLVDAMFGKGGKITATMVALDKNTVVTAYVPAKDMKPITDAVKEKKDGLSSEAEVKKAEALLPKDPQWLFYLNPGGMVEFVSRLIKAAAPIPLPIPAYPKSPPIGLAIKVDATGMDARLAMTGSAIESLGVYIQKVRALAGGNVN